MSTKMVPRENNILVFTNEGDIKVFSKLKNNSWMNAFIVSWISDAFGQVSHEEGSNIFAKIVLA